MTGPRVLVIEDDETINEALCHLLADEGYETRCTMTLADGLAAVDSWPPACLVLDLNLPDGSGERLLTQLTSEQRAPPTILLSASTSAARVANRFGIPHVRKPFDIALLLAAVAMAIEQARRPVDAAK